MKQLILLLTCSLLGTICFSQVGIGTEDPDASAILDLNSTTQGLLPPRMTDDDRNNISTPPAGLTVWCTNCGANGEMQVYNGDAWVNLMGGDAAPPSIISATGKIWMDRNLGANQVATSPTDAASYGDLYQWGRAADGHEKILRVTGDVPTSDKYTNVETASDGVANFNSPGGAWDGKFITRSSSDRNWVDPAVPGVDDLWQGVNGINNPCPAGFRIPTQAEWQAEIDNGIINNQTAFNSLLKLPMAGDRTNSNGSLFNVGTYGYYWSSTVSSTDSRYLAFSSSNASMNTNFRANGFSVRCLKD